MNYYTVVYVPTGNSYDPIPNALIKQLKSNDIRLVAESARSSSIIVQMKEDETFLLENLLEVLRVEQNIHIPNNLYTNH